MSQLILRNITYGHGGNPLVKQGQAVIGAGQKVCIIGRNGVGKSTLMQIILGKIELTHGQIESAPGTRIAYLEQTIPQACNGSIQDIVAAGLENLELEDWDIDYRVERTLTQMQLPSTPEFASLSGGLKRRVLLARAIVSEPDILLLDEPTNHLDIAAIEWLENFLKNCRQTLIFITHDRALMSNVANAVLDIDFGQINYWQGTYEHYCKHKLTEIAAREKADALFDRKLAEEEVWIRKGIKARRTRNEGRVRALKAMRVKAGERRQKMGKANIVLQDLKASGKLVFEVDNISFHYDDTPMIKDFSWICARGDKVGIIGANGAGKSTLIQLLLGELTPQTGSVKVGTKLEVAYFDQQQKSLDLNKSLAENIAGGQEQVSIDGKQKHVLSYLQDFLFMPERARKPMKYLSGGEKNRALLARLFLKPFNCLIMDEPTNDLDIETLELLETRLSEYAGTLLLVSHDRTFLNNIVTSTLALPGNGQVNETIGGYDDYLKDGRAQKTPSKTKPTQAKHTSKSPAPINKAQQRELNNIAKQIEKLEAKLEKHLAKMAKPNFYEQEQAQIDKLSQTVKDLEQEIKTAYERWESLEEVPGTS